MTLRGSVFEITSGLKHLGLFKPNKPLHKFSGSDELHQVAWYGVTCGITLNGISEYDEDPMKTIDFMQTDNISTQPVKTKRPNRWGIYDRKKVSEACF